MISKSRMRCLRRLRRDVGLLWMLSVGAELLWSPVLRANICERTAQVQAALVAAMDVEDCRAVTPAALEAVTALDLSHQALPSLSVGDFADLVRLKTPRFVPQRRNGPAGRGVRSVGAAAYLTARQQCAGDRPPGPL